MKSFFKYIERVCSVLLCILLFTCALTAFWEWHRAHPLPAGHDSQMHFSESLRTAVFLESSTVADFHGFLNTIATPKYMPLTYLLTASIQLITGFTCHGFFIATMLIIFLALIWLAAGGCLSRPLSIAAVLPPAAFLSTKAAWEVGASFSLEASVTAAAAVSLVLFLHADQLKNKIVIFLAGIFLFTLTLSKAVALLTVLPTALILCLEKDPKLRRVRIFLLLFILAAATYWILPRIGSVASEMSGDYAHRMRMKAHAPNYYWKSLIYDYRFGVILAIAPVLALFRLFHRDVTLEDPALFFSFAVPLIFYHFVGPNTAIYLLPCTLALPLWIMHSLRRLKNNVPAVITVSLISLLYSVFAFQNIGTVFSASKNPDRAARASWLPQHPRLAESDPIYVCDAFSRGQKAVIHDRFSDVLDYSHMILTSDPDNVQAMLWFTQGLKSTENYPYADQHWEILFNRNTHELSWQKILQSAADLEIQKKLPRGFFDKIHQELLKVYADDPQRLVSILKETVRADLKNGQISSARQAIEDIRGKLLAEQVPLLNYINATIEYSSGNFENAYELLDKNITALQKDSPLCIDSVILLSEMEWDQGQKEKAAQTLKKADASGMNTRTHVVQAALKLTKLMEDSQDTASAYRFLSERIQDIYGTERLPLDVELARLSIKMGNRTEAKKILLKIRNLSMDENTKTTVAILLNRVKYNP